MWQTCCFVSYKVLWWEAQLCAFCLLTLHIYSLFMSKKQTPERSIYYLILDSGHGIVMCVLITEQLIYHHSTDRCQWLYCSNASMCVKQSQTSNQPCINEKVGVARSVWQCRQHDSLASKWVSDFREMEKYYREERLVLKLEMSLKDKAICSLTKL